VLLDAKTNLVVDFLINVIPPGASDSQ